MRIPAIVSSSLCLLFLFCAASGGERGPRSVASPSHTAANDVYHPFLINNVFNYYGNNGDGSFNPFSSSNEGFEFPKGSGLTCVYEDGVVWGGYHKGRATPTVGGSVYNHGLQAGPILQYGTATTNPVGDDPTNPSNRIYRVRPDINPRVSFADVQSELQTGEVASIGRYQVDSARGIYDQYIKDWNEWPASQGAPFGYGRDSNNVQRTSGPYDPRFDIPGRPGADQTLWYVANDCDPARVFNLAGSPVIGLEMQRTIWGYNRAEAIGQTIFTSTLLINKSGAQVDSMFLVQWVDPDLGYPDDDLVGCDTSRNFGFVYNGTPIDKVYGAAVPAVGFDILQGPIVPGAPGDTAAFRMQKRPGYRNLRMSAFSVFTQGSAEFVDPIIGPGGDVQWYRLMHGMVAVTGGAFIDPTTGMPSKFCFYGDPLSQHGWLDGTAGGLSPGDRRMCLVTGPFTMAAGDTQEIVVALVAGLGIDYVSSIAVMLAYDDLVQSAFNSMIGLTPVTGIAVSGGRLPVSSQLMQNYPNPFNPSTTIVYSLPARTNVLLTVFNPLGQPVATLVRGEQEVGRHEVKFDGTKFASGLYFYRIQAGSFVQTKKCLLLK